MMLVTVSGLPKMIVPSAGLVILTSGKKPDTRPPRQRQPFKSTSLPSTFTSVSVNTHIGHHHCLRHGGMVNVVHQPGLPR